MTRAQLKNIEEIFHAALDCDPSRLSAFLDTACAGDELVRRKVEALLTSYQDSTDFIEQPPIALAAKIIQNEAEPVESIIGRIIGHYKIIEPIGTGGMGVVYLAADTRSDRKAALKLLPARFTGDAGRLKRFQQEARTVVALNHPNILTVYEIGEEDSSYYMVSEIIEGETLRQRLARGPFLPQEAVDIAVQIASALAAAHAAGIVHRDIKPENVMVRHDGYVKVLDFGIAKLAEPELPESTGQGEATEIIATNAGSVLGTVRYMSPEQARGDAVDVRSDIWSLGVLLYEMLAGRPPFCGHTSAQPVESILSSEPTPLNQVPTELRKIVNTALRKNRDERFSSMNEILEALKHFHRQLEFETELGRASIWLRWLRRPRGSIFALLLVSALFIATGVFIAGVVGGSRRSQPSPAPSTIAEKSVAVLPFQNLSNDPQKSFFADGIQDEILTDLSWISDLKVISRTSVMQYKSGVSRNLREIGQQLSVAYVVEGSVQPAANRVRINVQLIDARNDAHLWAETYDRDPGDIFAVQSEIAKTVADQLHAKLSPEEKTAIEKPPTNDLAAFDLYTRARLLANRSRYSGVMREKLVQAADLLDQAVAHDGQFLRAYCDLADVHDMLYLYNWEHTPARLAFGDKAVQAALRLQPDSAEAHLALGRHLYEGYLDYDRARAEIAIARRSLPNDPRLFELLGHIDRREGRWEESGRNFERALQLDPRNVGLLQQIAVSCQMLRDFRQKTAILNRVLAIVPGDADTRVTRAAIDLDWRADPRPLHQAIDEILTQDPSAAPSLADLWFLSAVCERNFAAAERSLSALGNGCLDYTPGLNAAFGRGLIARMRGDEPAARAAFAEARSEQEKLAAADPQTGPTLCILGLIDAGLGRKQAALAEGRRGMELLPLEKDHFNGIRMIEYFAVIAAWTGEKDLALETLARAVKLPGRINYGKLRLHPFWDPLRGDPRFDKIVASLAPKP